MQFRHMTLDMKELIDSYTFRYGEGSCQHSFVSSFCYRRKYGDMFCEKDNFLYTLRSLKCTDSERRYLFPHGDRSNIYALRQAIMNVIDDAHEHNARVRFETLTASAKDIVCSLFPGQFTVEARRDYAEYIYTSESMRTYAGAKLAYKRRDYQRFLRDYEGRHEAARITPKDIDDIREFQSEWLNAKLSDAVDSDGKAQIMNEDKNVNIALDNFEFLGLSGVMVKIDGRIKGYAYGAKLSDDYFNDINENCDHTIPNIYPFLRHELARLCCDEYKYINFEEDVGSESLRTAKNHYKPAFLIDKFILCEA